MQIVDWSTGLGVANPWVLALLPLAVLPCFGSLIQLSGHACTRLVPSDWLSTGLDRALTGLGVLAIASIVIGMAGPYRGGTAIDRVGRGAHIVLALDRSSSMDQTFAGAPPQGGEESKAQSARRLLVRFVEARPADMYAITAFSTTAMQVLPWTTNVTAVKAATQVLAQPGLAFTHVAKGLAMALSFFQRTLDTGSRVIILVSDGAAIIDYEDQQKLKQWFQHFGVSLYWIFLRTANSPGLTGGSTAQDGASMQAQPERFLHQFFQELGVPYRAYEAEDPTALAKAIDDIGRLEQQPLRYQEVLPKYDLDSYCFTLALGAVLLLLAARRSSVQVD